MKRTEIARQLSEIKIEVISSKTKLKKITEAPEWEESIEKEKDNSTELLQTFTAMIDQLTRLEKSISSRR